jgi:hypothetical protein
MLFTAVALLALTSFALAVPADIYFSYPCDAWIGDGRLPLTSMGTCWQGTPIPDDVANVEIYTSADVLLGVNTPMNGFAVCGEAGFFISWSAFTIDCPGDPTPVCPSVYAKVVHQNCVYKTGLFQLVTGTNAIDLVQSDWTCTCEEVPEYDDLGDLGVTPMPPLATPDCPNVGPAGVPYPTGAHPAGPCHAVPSAAWLGAAVNAEAAPKIQDLDQFDDGVVFLPGQGPSAPAWDACTMQSVIVTVSGNFTTPVYLSGWKDGNVDGDFADMLCNLRASEWIIQDFPIPAPGSYTFTFMDPGCATLVAYTGVFRFRLSHAAMGAGWWNGGHDELGEVEDYYIEDLQLPVELTAAPTVTAGDRELTVSFNVSDQTDINTYEIWRDGVKVTDITKANNSYSYADKNLINNRLYNYTIVAVGLNDRKELSFDGKSVWSGSPSYMNATVTEYALHQNYPNPFNPSTEIVYDVLQTGVVTLKVFNVMGQEVATLVNGTMEAGRHAATFDATGLTSGLYFYTITIGDQFSATKKMLLVQ